MKKRDSFFTILVALLIVVFLFPIEKNLGYHLDKYLFFLFFLLPALAWLTFYLFSFLQKRLPTLWQFGKFIEVGVLNTMVDWGILNLLMLLTNIASGFYYSFFKSISFALALFNSYFFNKFWTFETGKRKEISEFLKFVFISLIGFLINVGVASLIVNFIGPHFGISLKLWANLGAAVATLFSMFWNFAGYKFFVFKK